MRKNIALGDISSEGGMPKKVQNDQSKIGTDRTIYILKSN